MRRQVVDDDRPRHLPGERRGGTATVVRFEVLNGALPARLPKLAPAVRSSDDAADGRCPAHAGQTVVQSLLAHNP